MIGVRYSKRFVKFAQKLSHKDQERLADQIELLKENPFHSYLHTKPLSGPFAGLYSFRITRNFRVLFVFVDPDEIKLIDIGDRKDIYK